VAVSELLTVLVDANRDGGEEEDPSLLNRRLRYVLTCSGVVSLVQVLSIIICEIHIY
jgi:hypothetical protein